MIELIISVMILGILAVYTFSFLGNSVKAYVEIKQHKILYDEARQAMEKMVIETRNSSRSSITTGTSSITFTLSGNNITYSLNGTTLQRQVGNNTANKVADNVSSFTTSYSSYVSLELVLTQTGMGTVHFRTSIYPLNS